MQFQISEYVEEHALNCFNEFLDFEIHDPVKMEDVESVFSWVADDCSLTMKAKKEPAKQANKKTIEASLRML